MKHDKQPEPMTASRLANIIRLRLADGSLSPDARLGFLDLVNRRTVFPVTRIDEVLIPPTNEVTTARINRLLALGLGERLVLCRLGPQAMTAGECIEWLEAHADRPVFVDTPLPGKEGMHLVPVSACIVSADRDLVILMYRERPARPSNGGSRGTP
jgi:hypothetical protein